MVIFAKESLETLKSRVVLADVLEAFIELKKAGAAYKGLCPFHDEKTPSFVINPGDTHYHCFGCGAHGDAISFLMNHQKLSFIDSVEYLADKFQVRLEKTDQEEIKGPSKKAQREALEFASRVYHTLLIHTEEGIEPLKYLLKRGISLQFIKKFNIGYAPIQSNFLHSLFKTKNISFEVAETCGLTKGHRDFFSDRILFPICASTGHVIGFSGRKYKEETFGGKYINTPETPLFKKSRVLFGLNYSRQKIVKERKALIVEGQIDALRLIDVGLDYTVAGQGTAFGSEHVAELNTLGILTAYLAFDPDLAGTHAAVKVGDLFQKAGIEAKIIKLPPGYDPDSLIKEKGLQNFLELMNSAEDFIHFLIRFHEQEIDISSPAGKNQMTTLIGKQIRGWDHELMVHESLKKLAHLLNVPESMLGIGQPGFTHYLIKKHSSIGLSEIDPEFTLEMEVLKGMMTFYPKEESIGGFIVSFMRPDLFNHTTCKKIFTLLYSLIEKKVPFDFISILCELQESEQTLFREITEKPCPSEKGSIVFKESLQRLLDRNCINAREKIRVKIQSGVLSDEEALELTKEFKQIARILCINT